MAGVPGPPPPKPLSNTSYRVILCVVGLFVGLAILMPLMITAGVTAKRRFNLNVCSSNLSQMWKMQNIYKVQFGGPNRAMPQAVGGALWHSLEKTVPPLIDATHGDFFLMAGGKA